MLCSDLWTKKKYTTPADCVINRSIIEVDIKAAGLSMLAEYGAISIDDYNYILSLPKNERVVVVGKMQASNSKFTDIIQQGIENTRKVIFDIFSIEDKEVIAIRNDAVIFIRDFSRKGISNVPGVESTQYGFRYQRFIQFGIKNEYTSFYKLGKKELLYGLNPIAGTEVLHVAGIGEENLKLHENYMMDLFRTVFMSAQCEPLTSTLNLLNNIYNSYISKSLDMGYYRRFDSFSRFDISSDFLNSFGSYQADFIDNIDCLDISYNAKIIRDLIRMYSSLYFSRGSQ